ncbi:hypothetical protein BO94DRAFT_537935 [Aspergillus sclerotioniger CBS 115572]|uniref:Uncharacterized protein n=1 Tax=Aspergillus sclerotioniger CBS 115572 TaxID=1450535 RepID=A0A317VYQ3_9EURO|nr:hypothetical protein BO94DRAFT_537935 [Aspergillus sclerotioniger CBS 115572]PWY78142.1 hypothetical protein BO94DRAFT_537935 [Aspergillus sclerotioniger CBS 115572]
MLHTTFNQSQTREVNNEEMWYIAVPGAWSPVPGPVPACRWVRYTFLGQSNKDI